MPRESVSDPVAQARLRAFGQAVRQARLRLSVSQEHLALEHGLDRTFVSAVERGVRNPSLLALYRLAEALDVTLCELLP